MRDVVIVDAIRTPTGRRNGALSGLRPDDTLGVLIGYLVKERLGIDPELVQDHICGCVTQIGEQGLNIARNALLAGGFPPSVPGVTVNRQEGSSLQAIAFAAQAISAGEMDVVIASGVEFMSRQPMGSDGFGDHISHLGSGVSPRLLERFGDQLSGGMAAELMAEKWGFGREELDAYAKRSYDLAVEAAGSNIFASAIMAVQVGEDDGGPVRLEYDEGVVEGMPLEELASLPPAFKPGGVITAGNSGKPADAAAAVLLMSGETCSELGLEPKARYVCTAVSGEDPVLMLSGPISATTRALAEAGLSMEDIDLFEINEVFAPVPMVWMKEFNPPRPERVNSWGGAIANGNPLGASGAMLACSLISGLSALDGRYGLASTCISMGMGIATILERVS